MHEIGNQVSGIINAWRGRNREDDPNSEEQKADAAREIDMEPNVLSIWENVATTTVAASELSDVICVCPSCVFWRGGKRKPQ